MTTIESNVQEYRVHVTYGREGGFTEDDLEAVLDAWSENSETQRLGPAGSIDLRHGTIEITISFASVSYQRALDAGRVWSALALDFFDGPQDMSIVGMAAIPTAVDD